MGFVETMGNTGFICRKLSKGMCQSSSCAKIPHIVVTNCSLYHTTIGIEIKDVDSNCRLYVYHNTGHQIRRSAFEGAGAGEKRTLGDGKGRVSRDKPPLGTYGAFCIIKHFASILVYLFSCTICCSSIVDCNRKY